MKKKIFYLIILVAFLSSCVTPKYSQINHSKFYDEDYPGNVFKTAVFNTNDSISELFVEVNVKALAELSGKSKTDAVREFIFDYSLNDANKEKQIVQTRKINLAEKPYNWDNLISFKVRLRTQAVGEYVLFASLENKNDTKTFTSRTNITKGVSYSEQNFMLLNEDGSIHWDHFARGDEKLRIRLSDLSVNKLYISWYAPKFSPAVVPFAQVQIDELKNLESTRALRIDIVDGKSAPLAFKDLGVYLFHIKPNEKIGFSILKYFSEFPYVINDAQRLFALRYLNPRFEFEDMMSMEPAKAVEEFWYFKGREKERSDDLVRTYYSRVQRANELFTSYKEGWKTDRGMIFIVYGNPDKIFRFKDREIWEYGYESFYSGLRFQFTKINNPLSQNDFSLFREARFEPSWQGIVNNWRTDI